jgi:hypothetical protein
MVDFIDILILNEHVLFFGEFRKEALKDADELSALPFNLRISALEKILRRLLTGTKYKMPQQGNRII